MPKALGAAVYVGQSRFSGGDLESQRKETSDGMLRRSRVFRTLGPEPILTVTVAHVTLVGRSQMAVGNGKALCTCGQFGLQEAWGGGWRSARWRLKARKPRKNKSLFSAHGWYLREVGEPSCRG